MIAVLARFFIKTDDPQGLRHGYGVLCGLVGVGLNLLLFGGKFFAGLVSGSIAITADAFNNLSDAGSSVVTLLGFKLANQEPDLDHPFGHGRFEYLSGLMVAMLILLMGADLFKTSIQKILHPEEVVFSWLVLGILVCSILGKLYMWQYNRTIGRRIQSPAMEAVAADSLSDALATTAVLIATIVGEVTHLQIDGWCGLVVSGFILVAGARAGRETMDPLLGVMPSPEFVADIQRIVMADDTILGIHDLIVHDYGPGRKMISLHAEVPANGDFLHMHDVIDNAELQLRQQLRAHAVIHMDPIVTHDGITTQTRQEVMTLAQEIDPALMLHDFRMVQGPTHTNLIFDLVVPFGFAMDDKAVEAALSQKVAATHPTYRCVMEVERAYV